MENAKDEDDKANQSNGKDEFEDWVGGFIFIHLFGDCDKGSGGVCQVDSLQESV